MKAKVKAQAPETRAIAKLETEVVVGGKRVKAHFAPSVIKRGDHKGELSTKRFALERGTVSQDRYNAIALAIASAPVVAGDHIVLSQTKTLTKNGERIVTKTGTPQEKMVRMPADTFRAILNRSENWEKLAQEYLPS